MDQNKEKVSLIIEGGAMRGVFGAGIISTLLRSKSIDYVIGVSSGSANGINYTAKTLSAPKPFVDIVKPTRFSRA